MLSTIIEMGRAWFRAYTSSMGNETALDAKLGTNDPVKHRMGTFDKGNGFGHISGDFLVGDSTNPSRQEKVRIGLTPDDDSAVAHWIAEGKPGGAFQVSLQRPGTDDDPNQIKVLCATTRYIELFGRRLIEIVGGIPTWKIGGAAPAVDADHLISSNGRFTLYMQGDGNLVIYRNDTGAPIWASNTVTP